MYEGTVGKDSWVTANARFGQGKVLTGLGRFADAERELLEAERVLSSAQAVPTGRHQRCVELLVKLYEAWAAAEPGTRHEASAAKWAATLQAISPAPGKNP